MLRQESSKWSDDEGDQSVTEAKSDTVGVVGWLLVEVDGGKLIDNVKRKDAKMI